MRRRLAILVLTIALMVPILASCGRNDADAHTGWHAAFTECRYGKVWQKDAYMWVVYDNTPLGYHHVFGYYGSWYRNGWVCWTF
jgi:hypothetical protein